MRWARPIVLVGSLSAAGVWALLAREPAVEPATPSPLAPAPLPAVTREGEVSRSERVALGTLFSLEVEADEAVATSALHAAMSLLNELDRRWSAWRPGSDLWSINARAGGEPVQVAARTAALLQEGVEWSNRTEGLYQPTLGSEAAIQIEGDRVAMPDPDMRVDLGGLEAAYAAREIMKTIAEHSVTAAVVRMGDDVFARGAGHELRGAAVVGNPRWPGQVVERFEVDNAAAVTVSDARRALAGDGGRRAAVTDPRTGQAADGCQSATVVTDDPVRASVHARVMFVLGAAAGLEWAERHGDVEASILDSEGRRHRSTGWRAVARATGIDEVGAVLSEVPAPVESAPLESVSTDEAFRSIVDRGRVQLGRTEVTNADYRKFLDETRDDPHAFCHPREPEGHDHTPRYQRTFSPRLVAHGVAGALAPFRHDTFNRPDAPVVGVAFWDAWAYARWAGEALPTRAQWMGACAGPKGRRWPWGDDWKPRAANTGGERDGERDGHVYAAAADSFAVGISPAGCLNMAGNVAEWTADGWAMGGSSRSMPSGVTCSSGQPREPGFRAFDLGFRTARGSAK